TGTIRILDISDQALESGLFVQTASGELFITGEITSAMQLAAGSALHPGSSPGCVESTSLTNLAGVELYVELEGPTACAEYDQLQFGDQAVDVTDAELVLSGDYFPADGDVFVILQRSSSSSVSGTFVGLPEEAIIVFNNSLLQINYNNGSGVTLTAVAVLPLDLLSFTGEAREKTNLLTWTTANEEDFSHFEVQRSSAEASASPDLSADWWETIGEIAGGQSGQYSFEDDPITAYYRLKMVDLDGTFTYSEVILLENILGAAAGAMWVYPNPSTGRFTVDLSEVSISFQEAGELRLVDRYGRTVWTRSLAPRQPTPPIELSQRPAGVYLLTLVTDHGQSLTKRIVIR
ncbi:MAG: T9SS type A sorting domain-containing protein, partial [Bacteroidota bacterium]